MFLSERLLLVLIVFGYSDDHYTKMIRRLITDSITTEEDLHGLIAVIPVAQKRFGVTFNGCMVLMGNLFGLGFDCSKIRRMLLSIQSETDFIYFLKYSNSISDVYRMRGVIWVA